MICKSTVKLLSFRLNSMKKCNVSHSAKCNCKCKKMERINFRMTSLAAYLSSTLSLSAGWEWERTQFEKCICAILQFLLLSLSTVWSSNMNRSINLNRLTATQRELSVEVVGKVWNFISATLFWSNFWVFFRFRFMRSLLESWFC